MASISIPVDNEISPFIFFHSPVNPRLRHVYLCVYVFISSSKQITNTFKKNVIKKSFLATAWLQVANSTVHVRDLNELSHSRA